MSCKLLYPSLLFTLLYFDDAAAAAAAAADDDDDQYTEAQLRFITTFGQ